MGAISMSYVIVFEIFDEWMEETTFHGDRADAMTAFACKLHALLSGNLAGVVRAYGPAGEQIQNYVVQSGDRPDFVQRIVKIRN